MPLRTKRITVLSCFVVWMLLLQSCDQKGNQTAGSSPDSSLKSATVVSLSSANNCGSGTNDCYDKKGALQSPINMIINKNNEMPIGKNVLEVNMDNSSMPVTCFLDVSHGDDYAVITVNITEPSSRYSVLVNGVVYKLRKFHYHNHCEHITREGSIENEMEMHLIFQSDSSIGNTVVLGIVFNAAGDKGNQIMDSLWPKFAVIKALTDTQKLSISLSQIGLHPLTDYFKTYWCYAGSLTTPCFDEGLTWVVSKEFGIESVQQLQQYRSFMYKGKNIGSARSPQPLRNRILLSR